MRSFVALSPFAKFIFFFVAIGLTACGGGGGGSNSSQPPSTPTTPSPPATPTPQTELTGSPLQYRGATSAVAFTSTNAMESMRTGFFVAYISNFIPSSCAQGGSIQDSGPLASNGNGTFFRTWTNCKSDGIEVTGNAKILVSHSIIGGVTAEDVTLTFNSLRITEENNFDTEYSGSIQSVDVPSCSAWSTTTINIVGNDRLTGDMIKAENYQVISSDRCGATQQLQLSGRIYDSTSGFFDLTTSDPFRQSSDNVFFFDQPGKVVLTGANNSTTTLAVKQALVFQQSTINVPDNWVEFDVDPSGNGTAILHSQMTISAFESSAAEDIADTDHDGLPNSWESYYGLNPLNSSDANADTDNDGFTNRIEYDHHSDPKNILALPVASDLQFSFDTPPAAIRAGNPFTVKMWANNPATVYGAQASAIQLTKSSNATWYDISGCTSLSADQIQCSLGDISQESLRALTVELTADAQGPVSLTGSVTTRTFDPNTINNAASETLNIGQRESNLSLSFSNTTPKAYGYAIIGAPHHFKIMVSRSGLDEARNAIVTINLPPQVQALTAAYGVGDALTTPNNCSLGAIVRCNLGTIAKTGATYSATIDVEIVGITQGIYAATATIASDSIEQTPSDNALSFDIFSGLPLTTIQSAINVATATSTVAIPDGHYIGSLDFGGKNVHLRGQNGAATTRLWNTDLIAAADGSVVSDLTLMGTGRIALSNGAITLRKNIFNGVDRVLVGYQVDATIDSNLVTNAHGETDINCTLIATTDSSLRIVNNIFANNTATNSFNFKNCTPVYASNETMSRTITIANNTFYRNDRAIAAQKLNNSSTSFQIFNNTFVENQTAIEVTDGNGGSFTPSIFNNLTFINTTNYLNINSGSLLNNFDLAPLFVDPTHGNFHLNAGSPAVDAGSDVGAPSIDFDGIARPRDGNADGAAHTDVGAFEL